ncbi:MAG: hypothetical protein WCQ53_08100, partial [bacterium]
MGRPSKISIACPHYTKQGISCSIRLRSHGFYLGKEQPLIKRFRCSAPNCNFNKIFQFIPEKNNWLPYCKKERHKKLDLDDVIKNGSLEKILKAIKTYHVTQVEQSKSGVSSDDTHDDTNSRTKHCFALIEKEFEYPKG